MIRNRRLGFTLLEVLTVVVISASVFLGFVILLYDITEQMHISWQLRDAEEYGHWYVNEFVDKMRNGIEKEITRQTAPSEAMVIYFKPSDFRLPKSQRISEEWEFEYDNALGLPIIRVDDVKLLDPFNFFPANDANPRDIFHVDPESFKITKYSGGDLVPQQSYFRDEYLTIEFEITYQHLSVVPRLGMYERTIPFTGSVYVINDNWPVFKPPVAVENN